MSKVCIICEKPSAARNFGKALGGSKGSYQGTDYVITAARGHLFELADPATMVPSSRKEHYEKWDLANLPWNEGEFDWRRTMKKGASATVSDIKRSMAGCDEVVIASDVDPSGEGDLLIWEILEHLDITRSTSKLKITRMEFTDEAVPSIQKAFVSRRAVTSMLDEADFRKAWFRTRWDLLSMQWTRAATKVAGDIGRRAVLRNGRLKSAMVVLVGDGLKAHLDYKKVPFYTNKFRDENGVVYASPEEQSYPTREQVPGGHTASPVVADGVKRKSTPPPKLLDLAGLSALLSKKGVGAKDVLSIYQRLYEAQIVSYPRTEDKFVTPEQFKELEPLVDQIAGVVGINPAKLTHRAPRKSHVRTGGAHGANRPGPNVPASLDAVESTYGRTGRLIYETLAKNYLTMLGSDYLYDQHSGHVEKYPEFVGSVAVPVEQGWKAIFDADAEAGDTGPDEAEGQSSANGLGKNAEPFVHEGFPPRPPHPSTTWLAKQLERYDVGTGATRTSTLAEVTSGKTALMNERRGKLTLTDVGELNHLLLPGTHIGDLGLTERVYSDMTAIAAGSLTADTALAPIKNWVSEDIEKMRENARNVPPEVGEKLMSAGTTSEYAEGIWNGNAVKFKREKFGHRFTDDEVAKLLAGETISIEATSAKDGSKYKMDGKLEAQSFTNDEGKTIKFIGFAPDRSKSHVTGVFEGKEVSFKKTWGPNEHWPGHTFTADEIKTLLAGGTIEFEATSKKGKKYTAKGALGKGTYGFGFQLNFD